MEQRKTIWIEENKYESLKGTKRDKGLHSFDDVIWKMLEDSEESGKDLYIEEEDRLNIKKENRENKFKKPFKLKIDTWNQLNSMKNSDRGLDSVVDVIRCLTKQKCDPFPHLKGIDINKQNPLKDIDFTGWSKEEINELARRLKDKDVQTEPKQKQKRSKQVQKPKQQIEEESYEREELESKIKLLREQGKTKQADKIEQKLREIGHD